MDLGLKGKKVLVLGSSSGLGYAVAKAYVEEGAIVAVTSREEKRAEKACKEIGAKYFFAGDLREESEVENLIKMALDAFSGIDILVTNTGGPPKGEFVDITQEQWKEGFSSLFLSATKMIQRVLPYMKKNKWGRIILLTSTAAKEPILSLTVSSAIRAGLLGLMNTVSQQVASFGVTINSVLPGYTKTERLKELKISEEEFIKDIPAKRLASPEEIADLCLFLGSSKASYITGQAIACDGGMVRGI